MPFDAVEVIEIPLNYEVVVVDMLHYTLVVDAVEVIETAFNYKLGVLG